MKKATIYLLGLIIYRKAHADGLQLFLLQKFFEKMAFLRLAVECDANANNGLTVDRCDSYCTVPETRVVPATREIEGLTVPRYNYGTEIKADRSPG
jgi:hypothetical protein